MNIQLKLKTIMFLQFFVWGSWLITLGAYLINTLNFSGVEVGVVYGMMGISSLFMPSLLGIVADRWIPANRLYIICHFIGGITLIMAASVTSPSLMMIIMLIHSLAYMPTIAMSNSVSYYCLEQNNLDIVACFPKIRVFGTIGFIIAMWTVSLLRLELSSFQFYIAGGASFALCLSLIGLPKVPVSKKVVGKQSWVSLLGLEAFVLFKQPKMAVFFIFCILLGAVLQITNTFGGPFLHDFAKISEFKDSLVVEFPAILLSVSQMSEVAFILFVPFFMKRFGIKYVMFISMVAWSIRFALFGYGDPSSFGFILLLLSMIVYGCAFDFFNISGSMFVENSVDPKIRNSAQGLFMTMVNGIGAYLGSVLSGWVVDYFTYNGNKDWHSIWLVFAGYSIVIAIIFLFVFKNTESTTTRQQ